MWVRVPKDVNMKTGLGLMNSEDKGGAMSQGMKITSRRWERQRNSFSPKASRRSTALLILVFSPIKFALDF